MENYLILFYLFVLSVFDLKKKRVPVFLLAAGMVGAGTVAIYWIIEGQSTWLQAVLGAIPGMMLLVLAYCSGKTGYADGIVLMAIGIVKGYRNSLFVLGISLFGACLVSILLLLLRRVGKNTKLPYIPFLTAAFCIKEIWVA